MKVSTFFKILNKKIEKYEKIVTNPFSIPHPIVLIWVEDTDEGAQKSDFTDEHF